MIENGKTSIAVDRTITQFMLITTIGKACNEIAAKVKSENVVAPSTPNRSPSKAYVDTVDTLILTSSMEKKIPEFQHTTTEPDA